MFKTQQYTVSVQTKPFYMSLTFWVNFLVGIASFLYAFNDQNVVRFFISNPQLSADITRWSIGLLALINILLRLFKTKAPVTL